MMCPGTTLDNDIEDLCLDRTVAVPTTIQRLAEQVQRLRDTIRLHRDKKDHNPRHQDDQRLYKALPEGVGNAGQALEQQQDVSKTLGTTTRSIKKPRPKIEPKEEFDTTKDLRYAKLKFGLSQLSNQQLERIIAYPNPMCYDTWNYEEATGLF